MTEPCRCPDEALEATQNRDLARCTLCGGIVHLAFRTRTRAEGVK